MTTPRRGGQHPSLEIYAGDSSLDIDYVPTQDRPFHHVSQLRSEKRLAANQSLLITASNDIDVVKFNGKLEVTKEETAELDKEQFIETVKKNIQLFGLYTWYYIPGLDGTMLNLCDDYHAFNLEEVISNYKERCVEPLADRDISGNETTESLKTRFKCYDEFEFMTEVFHG